MNFESTLQNFYQTFSLHFPTLNTKTFFYVTFTILIAILVDNVLRSLIKVSTKFDNRRASSIVTILRNIVTILVYGVALNFILIELGINVTPLLASAGVIGVIIGLSARALIEDLITGLFLLSQDTIAIGDYVKIDEAEGYIESIGFRALTLRAETGALQIIPNGIIKKVINFSRHRSRMLIEIPVKSDQEITLVLKAANDALTKLHKDEGIAQALYPGSTIDGIEDFKSTGFMTVRATIITYPVRRFEVARKFRFLLKKEFEKHKIIFG